MKKVFRVEPVQFEWISHGTASTNSAWMDFRGALRESHSTVH